MPSAIQTPARRAGSPVVHYVENDASPYLAPNSRQRRGVYRVCLTMLALTLVVVIQVWSLRHQQKGQPLVASARAWPSQDVFTSPIAFDVEAHRSTPALTSTTYGTPLKVTLSYSIYLPITTEVYSRYRPDLVIRRVSFDTPNIVAGKPFHFSVLVHNQGSEDTAHGSAPHWFTVEVYIKDRAFVPAGPPANPLDHAGGFCSDASPDCVTGTARPEQVAFLGNLKPGQSWEVVFPLVFADTDLYDLYVQVDTTWPAEGYTGQYWGQHYEEIESNNIFEVENVYVPPAQGGADRQTVDSSN